jgi:hypothetical protein
VDLTSADVLGLGLDPNPNPTISAPVARDSDFFPSSILKPFDNPPVQEHDDTASINSLEALLPPSINGGIFILHLFFLS